MNNSDSTRVAETDEAAAPFDFEASVAGAAAAESLEILNLLGGKTGGSCCGGSCCTTSA